MDVQMPEMDGLTATRLIRQMDGPISRVPIVALTAHTLQPHIDECLGAGMDEHFPKPVDLDKMNVDAFDSLPLMIRDAEDPDSRVRAAAMDAMGQLGLPIDEAIIRKGLADETTDVRAETAETIGRTGLVSFAPELEQLLGDADWDVRFRAANALTQLGTEAIARLQQAALTGGQDPASRTASLVLAERQNRLSHA